MALVSISTFNANNFFLRYDFRRTYPGGEQNALAKTANSETRLGYLPGLWFGNYSSKQFVVWDDVRRRVAALALREPDDTLPDILCLQEVENIHALRVFNTKYLDRHYTHALLVDGYDPRNIDVGILSRFPIVRVRSHVDDVNPDGTRVFSRDCLEVTMQLDADTQLTLFSNHLRSKFVSRKRGETDADLERRETRGHEIRKAQARAVRTIVRSRFRADDVTSLYAVIGDFNDTPKSPWLSPLTRSSSKLSDVVRRHRPDTDCWTLYWRRKRRVTQIDYILGSRAFRSAVDAAVSFDAAYTPHIERGGIGYKGYNAAGDDILPSKVQLVEDDGSAPMEVPFRFPRYGAVLDDWKNNISDHCPVKVWLKI